MDGLYGPKACNSGEGLVLTLSGFNHEACLEAPQ
jgi:hypothetical protein